MYNGQRKEDSNMGSKNKYINEVQIVQEELLRNEKLLSLVNEAAAHLLTIEPEQFEAAMTENMAKFGECLDFDCIYVWKANAGEGQRFYELIHGWLSSNQDESKRFEELFHTEIIPSAPDWDDRMFGEQGYMAECTESFGESIRTMLETAGVQAIMAFPVFFQGNYWGYVTYENRHSEKLCTDREADILRSASLLLANAVEVNDRITQLNRRLEQQQLMSDISSSFVTKEPLEHSIQDALARMGDFLRADRALIAIFEKNSEISRPAYFWYNDDKYAPNELQRGFSGILRDLFLHSRDDELDNPSIYCNNTLMYKDGKFKIFYERGGLKSFVCIPVYVEGELWGVMSIENHEKFRQWSQSDINLVNMVSSSISNAVSRDVMEHERATALQKALHASVAKSCFLANMSHEIRTPMNAIIGMTTIGRSAQNLDKKDYAFDKIGDASRHLLGVINDILDMSKIEANKLELAPVVFDFEKMLQKAVNVISLRSDERRQKLYIHIDHRIPTVLMGDDQRLTQVITNLLSNAVKFTPEEGVIHLDTEFVSEGENGCNIQISVSDTGIGITEEQKGRLFNSYEQAATNTSRKYGGTGLGLTISKRIVEMMGGAIRIESEPGNGASFIFTVTLKRGVERRRPKALAWKDLRIFAVENDPEYIKFLMETADHLKITCDVVTTGEDAVDFLTLDKDYDIYFVDWDLPGITGIEVSKHILAKYPEKNVVMLSTATDWTSIEESAHAVGVEKFIIKPLFQSQIVDTINECLGVENVVGAEQRGSTVTCDDFSGNTILLAEDVEINREILSSLLVDTNINIDCAENGEHAFKKFVGSPDAYDMIFMDLQMPIMDGYTATKQIRSLNLPRAKEIPIVAMTANVFQEDINHCLEAGMNGHVGKPINFDEVMEILRKHLCKTIKPNDESVKVKILENNQP